MGAGSLEQSRPGPSSVCVVGFYFGLVRCNYGFLGNDMCVMMLDNTHHGSLCKLRVLEIFAYV